MNSSFFIWSEPLLLDNLPLRDYYLSGHTPPDQDFDRVLAFYFMLYELELSGGLLDGREMDLD